MGRKISETNSGSISNADTLDGLDSLDFELVSNKGQAGGYSSLDVNQKLLPINIPDIDSGTF